jgi:hypothetical protein
MRISREKMSAIKREAHRNRKMTCLRGNEVSNFDVHRVFSHLASSRVVAKEGLCSIWLRQCGRRQHSCATIGEMQLNYMQQSTESQY